MSEQERQAAIAKLEAQRYRKWLSWLILAPVLLCVGLAFGAPTITTYLARQEANTICTERVASSETIQSNPAFIVNSESTGTVITWDNIAQLTPIGDDIVEDPLIAAERVITTAIANPNADYIIYVESKLDERTRLFACDNEGNAVSAFSADETISTILFNPDSTLFIIAESTVPQVQVFNADAIDRLTTLTLSDESPIESVAFHPTQPLLVISTTSTLYIYNTDDFTKVQRIAHDDNPQSHEISFNADGSKLFVIQSTTNVPHAIVWGIE